MLHHSTTSRSQQSSLLTSTTRDEIHVAQILLDIATMIRTLEYGSGGLKWGRKKRRSRSDEAASPYHKTDVGEEKKRPPPPPPPMMEAAATASPVTPLCFAASESDDHKSKHLSKKTCKNKLRKEYIEMIEELSERRDLLRGEIENVTNYHNKLIAYNSQLKAMKQEALNSCPRKEEPKSESGIPKNHEMGVDGDRTAGIYRGSFSPAQFHWPYNGIGIGSIKQVGPIEIPDLNVCAQEMERDQPLDWVGDRRARCAEARRRRKDIIRVKSSVFKFPRTR